MPSTATSLKAALVELIINNVTKTKRPRLLNPKNKDNTISNAQAMKIHILLLRKLSMIYPITGFTNQAKVIMLDMTIIFWGENESVSLR